MNKEEILKNYKKEEDKLLVAKMLDQMELSSKRNKMQYTDFLDERQTQVLQKLLYRMQVQNNIIYGGFEEARKKDGYILSRKME